MKFIIRDLVIFEVTECNIPGTIIRIRLLVKFRNKRKSRHIQSKFRGEGSEQGGDSPLFFAKRIR
jgi:hypothetical protein